MSSSYFTVQKSFAGSAFTLAAKCPSGATVRPFYVSKEAAETIAGTLSEVLGERWEAVEASG